MIRRSFLSSLAALPFFSFLKKKEEPNIKITSGSGHIIALNDENPKNLPVALFDENGIMTNAKEILGDKKEALVFLNKEDATFVYLGKVYWGEVLLKIYSYPNTTIANYQFEPTSESHKLNVISYGWYA